MNQHPFPSDIFGLVTAWLHVEFRRRRLYARRGPGPRRRHSHRYRGPRRRRGEGERLPVAPDYYFRLGDIAKIGNAQDLMPKVNSKTDAELFADHRDTLKSIRRATWPASSHWNETN